jgi:mono/diheme cytochrome c family protein
VSFVTDGVTFVRPRSVLRAGITALCGWVASGCSEGEGEALARALAVLPPTPVEQQAGEAAFHAQCASCHGAKAGGTAQGPPLAHRVYEPSHHGDAAFRLAVRNGVAAHHWRFGNMPPQRQVTEQQLDSIIGYVRWIQRQVGIE